MLEQYWADSLDLKDSLMSFRQRGWELFERIGLSKGEAFQYLRKMPEFLDPSSRKGQGDAREGIVFVDGFFEEELSSVAKPMVCTSLKAAMPSYGLFLQSRMTRSIKEEKDPLAALNAAFHGLGAFLYVPPKCKTALHLTQQYTGNGWASPRLHIYLGRGAELELTQSSIGNAGLSNSLIDLVVDEGARITFLDLSEGHFQTVRANLKRDAYCKMVFLGKKIRNSLHVQLSEENSETEIYGLARLEGDAESHIHALVEHIAPHTRSRQHFKNVLKEKSRFSFEGKIYVRPEAQKTEGYQLNNSLILSEEATSYAKPNLEIFADDVKASHGATTGKLDEEMLFYLRSRGLNLAQAREWLIEGFCKEILDHAR